MQWNAWSRRLGLGGTAWNPVGRRRREEVSNQRRMTCELARDELSAQLDGEQSPSLTTTLAAEHLPGCTDCRNWQEVAHQLTRRVRLTSARPIPDRSAWILNAVLADRTERRPATRAWRRAHIGFVSFSASVTVVWRPAPQILHHG
jgi:predicted anti-sigma-YlaC factor YlaD